VSGTRGTATATSGDQDSVNRAKALVAKSPLSKRAAALIGKMGFGDASALQPLLLTTRAFLLAASDDQSGVHDLMNWMKTARAKARTAKVGDAGCTASAGPTTCWIEYTIEILAAFDEFVDCFNNIKWYDPFFPVQRCEVVYEVRILGAFAWWMGCLGLL
jgi:hypothetical protein